MKIIYEAATIRADWHPPQDVDATLIADIGQHRIKVTLHLDTSYRQQCRGAVSNLVGGKFEPLLTLTPDEIPVARWYHAMKAPQQGDMLRNGREFEETIAACCRHLAQVGANIVSRGQS